MKAFAALATLCIAVGLHAQAPLRLTGSTTVTSVLAPRQAVIEQAIGQKLEFSSIGTVSGFLSLLAGHTDVAMFSAPLQEVADQLNAKNPGRVDVSQFHESQIGEVRTVFIVNPHNPVRRLNAAQLAAVLTGETANWKDVGGADAPIRVVCLAKGGPLLEHLLNNKPIVATARTVGTANEVPIFVTQDVNAIGIISAAHARGLTSAIETDARVMSPLLLVTKGPPSETVQKLIIAARAAAETRN